MELFLVILVLPGVGGALVGWAIAQYVRRTIVRRLTVLAVAFAPLVYCGFGLSTACKVEREIEFNDCDDDEIWAAGLIVTAPAWLLATIMGAMFLPRRKEPSEP